jgi:hypothetical protein
MMNPPVYSTGSFATRISGRRRERGKRDLQLEPRERRADAVMNQAESQVRIVLPVRAVYGGAPFRIV